MTTRQLRDIAAYWGSTCRYELCTSQTVSKDFATGITTYKPYESWAQIEERFVDQKLFDLLPFRIRNFKLLLRPISALTDEEITRLVEILESSVGSLPDKNIYRQDEEIRVGADGLLRIHFDGLIEYNRHYSCHTAPMFAYLQSIGVWVPGTIDEELVELTP